MMHSFNPNAQHKTTKPVELYEFDASLAYIANCKAVNNT